MTDIDRTSAAPDAYLEKSPEAGRMGKAAEHLIAASAIIATRGLLNVSTSLVDDEGIDLVFHRRGSTRTLAVQVKTRFSDALGIQRGKYEHSIRSQTFQPRDDLDLLFAVVEVETGNLRTAYLIPSPVFATTVVAGYKGRIPFSASLKPDTGDRWRPYRHTAAELPYRLLARLDELAGA